MAIAVACITAAFVWAGHAPGAKITTDWSYIWFGARGVAHGQSPYTTVLDAIDAGLLPVPLFYPATATVLTVPLGLLPFRLSITLWSALGMGLLAFALSARTWWRLWALVSAPVLAAMFLGQWSLYLTAATALPWLGVFWVAKPSVGLAMFAGWPSRRAAIGCVVLLALSLLILPRWPGQWLDTLKGMPQYLSPLQRPGGFLLLLAWLRWRSPQARMLGTLAIVPHTTGIYEMVPLFLIPNNRTELAVLMAGTYLAQALSSIPPPVGGIIERDANFLTANWDIFYMLCYLPSLIMVLRRPHTAPGEEVQPRV